MKRFLCHQHAYQYEKDKPILLAKEDKCTICRWEARPYTFKDLVRHLEDVVANMRFAAEDEHYDPFGYTYTKDLEKTFELWAKMIHPSYRKNFFDRMKKLMAEMEIPKP